MRSLGALLTPCRLLSAAQRLGGDAADVVAAVLRGLEVVRRAGRVALVVVAPLVVLPVATGLAGLLATRSQVVRTRLGWRRRWEEVPELCKTRVGF